MQDLQIKRQYIDELRKKLNILVEENRYLKSELTNNNNQAALAQHHQMDDDQEWLKYSLSKSLLFNIQIIIIIFIP